MRGVITALLFLFSSPLSTPAFARGGMHSQIPPNCVVTSWCVDKASECRFMRMLNPTGLYQGEAQYSVVRKALMACRNYYGEWENRWVHSPVEAIVFRSDIETTELKAREEAERLCSVYREQWVSVAPRCEQ